MLDRILKFEALLSAPLLGRGWRDDERARAWDFCTHELPEILDRMELSLERCMEDLEGDHSAHGLLLLYAVRKLRDRVEDLHPWQPDTALRPIFLDHIPELRDELGCFARDLWDAAQVIDDGWDEAQRYFDDLEAACSVLHHEFSTAQPDKVGLISQGLGVLAKFFRRDIDATIAEARDLSSLARTMTWDGISSRAQEVLKDIHLFASSVDGRTQHISDNDPIHAALRAIGKPEEEPPLPQWFTEKKETGDAAAA